MGEVKRSFLVGLRCSLTLKMKADLCLIDRPTCLSSTFPAIGSPFFKTTHGKEPELADIADPDINLSIRSLAVIRGKIRVRDPDRDPVKVGGSKIVMPAACRVGIRFFFL